MSVALFCRNISGVVGGVERMVINVANGLSKRGVKVYIFSLDVKENPPYYGLSEKVTWIRLDVNDPLTKASFIQRFRRINTLRKVLRDISIQKIYCFQIGVFKLAAISSLFLNTDVYALERNSIQRFSFVRESKFVNILFLLFAKRIFVQFEEYIDDYPVFLRGKIGVLKNFHMLSRVRIQRNRLNLAFVGRISYQKNIHYTFEVFSKLCEINPNIQCSFIGEGELLDDLRLKVHNSKYSERITLLSPRQDWYLDPSIGSIVLLSKWEGCPNVLLEAMTNEIFCFGSRNTKGIRELLTNGRGALLSGEDSDIDAKEINNVLMKSDAMNDMLANALMYSRHYDFDIVVEEWLDTVKD